MVVPDFVIAGEPKSGTTVLYIYLAARAVGVSPSALSGRELSHWR